MKPSTSKAKSARNSTTSINKRKSNNSIALRRSNSKLGSSSKKMKKKYRKSIEKLFDKMRKESLDSNSTLNTSQENTVIHIDTTPDNKKRKLQNCLPQSTKRNRTALIILDDERESPQKINLTENTVENFVTPQKLGNTVENLITPQKMQPVQCSTPFSLKRCTNLDISKDISNLTKEINNESFVTIDLTTETIDNNTVIDLVNDTTENYDQTIGSSNASTLSGESNITVIQMKKKNKKDNLKKFVNGISKMNASEKGKLLELITQKIFNGCDVSVHSKTFKRNLECRAAEAEEDTYIKSVILGQPTNNSIGSNIYNPEREIKNKSGLRMVVIDGSNVAVKHGNGVFSVKGLKICIDYFVNRGHIVKAFVPRFRCKFGKSSDPRLLDQLEKDGLVVYTPSREVQGKFIASYDDRYIVQCAAEFDGVIVSCDNYRDLLNENPRWRFVIENRLLMFTWVNDMIMFPKDPLGRNGPTLEYLLRHQTQS